MRLDGEGKRDSATFFASMAIGAYEQLAPLDADLRYDFGRMAEMSGDLPLAQAQADAILASDTSHLLGLVLSIRLARKSSDTTIVERLSRQFAAAERSELARNLDEYVRHRADIDAISSQAGRRR